MALVQKKIRVSGSVKELLKNKKALVRRVVDIGGQDCRVIGVREDGKVREFFINIKCAAGMHLAIASWLIREIKRVGTEEDLTVTGDCARNEGLLTMLNEKVGVNIAYSKEAPQLLGAIGADVIARNRSNKLRQVW
jgi:activator of 2-hydroxyglutaryl-CoA dehydratase